MKRWAVGFAALVVPVGVGQAHASLVVTDLAPGSNDGLITLDTRTGLEWLDLTQSVGRTYDDVVSQFGSGRYYESFRYASMDEVISLFTISLGGSLSEYNLENTPKVLALQNLVGVTSLAANHRDLSYGLTGSSNTPGTHEYAYVQYFYPSYDNSPGFAGKAGFEALTHSAFEDYAQTMSWRHGS